MHFLPKILLTATVTTGWLLLTQPASAQILEYTTEASFDAATLSDDVITFDGSSGGAPSYSYGDPGTLTVGQVTFVTPPGTDLFAAGPNTFTITDDATGTLDPQGDSAAPSTLIAVLPTLEPFSLTSAGSEIGAFSPSTITATVRLVDGVSESFTYTAPDDSAGFLGFTTSSSAIAAITYVDSTPDEFGATDFSLDNFTYGVTIPEPSSWALLGLGALGLVVIYRRRLQA